MSDPVARLVCDGPCGASISIDHPDIGIGQECPLDGAWGHFRLVINPEPSPGPAVPIHAEFEKRFL